MQTQKISEDVSVDLVFDHENKSIFPKWVSWKNKAYRVQKIGLHHKFRQGRTLYHVFSVTSSTLFFRLILNTDNLHWKLEEISDAI